MVHKVKQGHIFNWQPCQDEGQKKERKEGLKPLAREKKDKELKKSRLKRSCQDKDYKIP